MTQLLKTKRGTMKNCMKNVYLIPASKEWGENTFFLLGLPIFGILMQWKFYCSEEFVLGMKVNFSSRSRIILLAGV